MTNETKELKTYTMQELYEHPLEPMACLVDGLLAPGLYILGGSPKVGKSWMALQLCLAVCGGGAFLGRATRKSEVLYLALEDGPQRLHSRALRLADTAPEGLHLCHRAAPILLQTAGKTFPFGADQPQKPGRCHNLPGGMCGTD